MHGSTLLSFLFLLALAQFVRGWGADTHPTIGYLAERYLLDETVSQIQTILASEPQFHGSIGSAANWADRQGRSRWNAGWHFVDAQDSPPETCSVNYDRDCPPQGGCVISAIKNHTSILKGCLADNSFNQRCSNALKYIVHFLGDITQPLHCSELSRGGNDIHIKFDSLRRSLHQIWDSDIPEKLVRQLDPPVFKTWTDQLHSRIDSDPSSFLSPPASWVECIDPDDAEDCAIKWATESNSFTCSYVYVDFTGVDLGGRYYEGAVPIVETQVAKAGLRLGVYLNLLITGKPGWGGSPPISFQREL